MVRLKAVKSGILASIEVRPDEIEPSRMLIVETRWATVAFWFMSSLQAREDPTEVVSTTLRRIFLERGLDFSDADTATRVDRLWGRG